MNAGISRCVSYWLMTCASLWTLHVCIWAQDALVWLGCKPRKVCRVHRCGFRFLSQLLFVEVQFVKVYCGMRECPQFWKSFLGLILEIHIPTWTNALWGPQVLGISWGLDNKRSEWRAAWEVGFHLSLGADGCLKHPRRSCRTHGFLLIFACLLSRKWNRFQLRGHLHLETFRLYVSVYPVFASGFLFPSFRSAYCPFPLWSSCCWYSVTSVWWPAVVCGPTLSCVRNLNNSFLTCLDLRGFVFLLSLLFLFHDLKFYVWICEEIMKLILEV